MLTLNVIYNDSTSYILDIINEFEKKVYLELYNLDKPRQRTKVRKLREDHGTKNVPLLVFQDENLDYFDAIWPEYVPDWREEIIKIINK